VKTEVSKSSDGPAVAMTDGDETLAATARRLPEKAASRHGGCAAGKETELAAAVVLEGFRVLRAMAREAVEEVAAAILGCGTVQRLGWKEEIAPDATAGFYVWVVRIGLQRC
jgi:hypothetical protein